MRICGLAAAVRAGAALGSALLLSACASVGGITGAVAGIASGSASGNPAVGVAVGIGVQAGIDATIKTVLRRWSQEEQARIAALVGSLETGQQGPWEVRHAVPYADEQGEVRVVRAFTTPLADCKEALFSVDDVAVRLAGQPRPYYVTTVCRGTQGWKWAVAEPAVARWGVLH
ncbi:hypothetical protein [Variovorax saccharolyticus]|uniref:hypothetical protein n=1 Tax=Variovorax saccharolyticus TaxID=3053516 RepID=UPI0025756DC0|nr:hypothetical protein [Variovorax sp. J22R187]MDM0018147.1 hypothetical protein [Variovorax sp. J22R187]